MILLYRHNCSHCQNSLKRYRSSHRGIDQGEHYRVALVEVPPYAEHASYIDPLDTRFHFGKLSDARQWYVTTPMELELYNGVVIRRLRDELQTRSAG